MEGFEARYPDHPFVVVNSENLKSKLRQLVLDGLLRQTLARRGRDWVSRHHDARAVVRQIHELAGLADSTGDSQTQNSKPGRTGPERVSLHTL
ncbi:MAG: glycosyltransferase family 1 protein [Calditrichaeota bacterium]|nr:MAG: glycosyltransferase family 1 protein [Calditrichota bacterium]